MGKLTGGNAQVAQRVAHLVHLSRIRALELLACGRQPHVLAQTHSVCQSAPTPCAWVKWSGHGHWWRWWRNGFSRRWPRRVRQRVRQRPIHIQEPSPWRGCPRALRSDGGRAWPARQESCPCPRPLAPCNDLSILCGHVPDSGFRHWPRHGALHHLGRALPRTGDRQDSSIGQWPWGSHGARRLMVDMCIFLARVSVSSCTLCTSLEGTAWLQSTRSALDKQSIARPGQHPCFLHWCTGMAPQMQTVSLSCPGMSRLTIDPRSRWLDQTHVQVLVLALAKEVLAYEVLV